MKATTAELLSDDLWPRDAEHRYRLYGRCGSALDVLAACPRMEGIGVAILQLHEDAREGGGEFGDHGQVGVLDAVLGEWVINPFSRPGV